MSTQPINTYRFDGYNVRPITEQDRPYLEMQIKADKYHRDWMTVDHFMRPLPGESSWALEDKLGRVVFYFKNTPVVRMTIQFTAEADLSGKRRNMAGLIRGLAWIEAIFKQNRFREIIFDTTAPELELFAKRHLGFVDAPNLLSRMLPTFEVPEMQQRLKGTVPKGKLERVG